METLSKSLNELESAKEMLTLQVVNLISHNVEIFFKWEQEKAAEYVAQTREQYKRFVPERMSLGYVESSSSECTQSNTRSPRDPKATSGEGIQAEYIDKKITQLYLKLRCSTSHGIDFVKRKAQNPFGQLTQNMYMCLNTRCVGFMVMKAIFVTPGL